MQTLFSILVLLGAFVGIVAGLMPASSASGNGLAAIALSSGLWVLFQSGVSEDLDGGAVFFSRRGLYSARRWRNKLWDDSMAPAASPEWQNLLLARNRAAAHYARQFLRGPEWVRKLLEAVLLALSATLNVDLFLLLGNATLTHLANGIMEFIGPVIIVWTLVWVVWVAWANRVHNRKRLRLDDDETEDEIAIICALGGWDAIGRRFNACCFGANVVLPSFKRGLLLAVPFASGALRLLWPHYHGAAIMAMLGVALAYFNYQAFLYYRMREQAVQPSTVSPCRSLPLRYFIRTTAQIRDRGGRLAIDIQRAIETKLTSNS